MLTIMLVDDEVLALDYLKNMVAWEEHGYQVKGCATGAKKALELYDRIKPDIVISDIRMPGMDGLELTRLLKEKNKDTAIILLSAYGDFDYAQKAIRYGVSNYLLKHELCEKLLLTELERAREQVKRQKRKNQICQEYFFRQLIYGTDDKNIQGEGLGNRLFLLLLHKRNPVVDGEFEEEKWSVQEREILLDILSQKLEDMLFYVADAQVTDNNWMVLYRIEHTASTYTVNGLIERKCAQICEQLKKMSDFAFDILYSSEIAQREISSTFRKMSRQIRYVFFYETNRAYPVCELPSEEHRVVWGEQIRELKDAVYDKDGNPERLVKELFEKPKNEERLDICKSLMPLLGNLLQEIRMTENKTTKEGSDRLYTVREVTEYYMQSFEKLHDRLMEQETEGMSRLVQDMIHYIHKNYEQELSLDVLGEIFQMNGVYLGQIFKKEVGVTFLKYLTNVRMEEAKRLLTEENCTVAKTARKVGYYTSQYFARVFARTVGMKPQEYKKWKEEE